MTAQELYTEARKRGLRLESVGDKLAVIPAKLCPPDFANALRQHKGEILALLEATARTGWASWHFGSFWTSVPRHMSRSHH
jgi:hypothetical protein